MLYNKHSKTNFVQRGLTMKKLMLIFFTVMLFSLIVLVACGKNTADNDMDKENEIEKQQDEESSDAVEKNTDNESDSTQENEASENEEKQTDDSNGESDIVLGNEAFRVFEPAPNAAVGNEFTIRGEAKVFEGTFMYEFEDGHNILDEGTVTASSGAPDWGKFEITIHFDDVAYDSGTVILYDESQKDGSRQNELFIPVTIEK